MSGLSGFYTAVPRLKKASSNYQATIDSSFSLPMLMVSPFYELRLAALVNSAYRPVLD